MNKVSFGLLLFLIQPYFAKSQFPHVYKNLVDFCVNHSGPKFELVSIDTITVFEIVTMKGKSIEKGCQKFNYFSFEKSTTNNFYQYLRNSSFVFFGEYFEVLRPSNYSEGAIKKYSLENFLIKKSDTLSYQLSETDFFKIFETKAILQKYVSSSKEWYKFYFPLKKPKRKAFYYYEIVEVIERKERQDDVIFNARRVPFICDISIK